MEPRAVVAAPTGAGGELTLWSSTQIPHILRVLLALTTGIPEHKLRVIAPDVGGGFGSKLQVYREEMHRRGASPLELGRPVKWTESRSENAQATHHGRDQIQDIELAVTNDGKILGHAGRPARQHGRLPAAASRRASRCSARSCTTRIYKMDAYDFTCTGVFTTTTPTDAYRGAGPAGGDVRHRADHGRPGGRARHRPDGAAPAELDQARGVPVHHDRRA